MLKFVIESFCTKPDSVLSEYSTIIICICMYDSSYLKAYESLKARYIGYMSWEILCGSTMTKLAYHAELVDRIPLCQLTSLRLWDQQSGNYIPLYVAEVQCFTSLSNLKHLVSSWTFMMNASCKPPVPLYQIRYLWQPTYLQLLKRFETEQASTLVMLQ